VYWQEVEFGLFFNEFIQYNWRGVVVYPSRNIESRETEREVRQAAQQQSN